MIWLVLSSLPGAWSDAFVKVVNGRCGEFVGVYPMGHAGGNWTSDLDIWARQWCQRRSWCVGFMRFIAEDSEHCEEWCGRPQFCKDTSLTTSEEWVSYLRAPALRPIGSGRQPSGSPQSLSCAYPHEGTNVHLWEEVPPVEALQIFGGVEGCRVLHHQQHMGEGAIEEVGSFFDGVLSETEHFVRFFSASTGGDVVPRGAERPWIFHFDARSAAPGSFDGKNKSQWTFEETSQALPGHVYVEDGTLETRRDAFVNYHFSVICMAGAAPASLLPQAVVDAVGFGCHPLVPTAYHERLQRVFFHLPDAVQPFIRMHPLILETYLDDMYNNPDAWRSRAGACA
eukprot:g15061.t1